MGVLRKIRPFRGRAQYVRQEFNRESEKRILKKGIGEILLLVEVKVSNSVFFA